MKYDSVLIEIEEADLNFRNPVRVTRDFKITEILGKAIVYKKEGKLYANIETYENAKGLYPAIGFAKRFNYKNLYEIGLCSQPNVDENIRPLP